MTFTQKFFKAILPKSWAADMEAESRAWKMKCSSCGTEHSVWEMGGIRWKAAGNPVRRVLCPNCKQVAAHTVYKSGR